MEKQCDCSNKGKGDALECGKYRGVRLLDIGVKLFEKVLEERLRKLIKVDGRQFGYCPGRSTTDAIFIMKQLQEKFSEKKKKLYLVFCGSGEGIRPNAKESN